MLAEALGGGSFLILFELVPLDVSSGDTDYYNINVFLGGDADSDLANNLTGEGTFTVLEDSLDVLGNPSIVFESATVTNGTLASGPDDFMLPLQLPEFNLDLTLTISETSLAGTLDLGTDGAGASVRDGTLCGYIRFSEIIEALNAFVAGNCGCLDLPGDLVVETDGSLSCTPAGNVSCDANDDIEKICPQIVQFCGPIIIAMPMLLDVNGEGISLGARFAAAPARIVGAPVAE